MGVERAEVAMAQAREALKEARGAVVMMIRRGEYGAAVEALAVTVEKAFANLGEALVASVKELRVSITELRKSLEAEVAARKSEIGGLRGEIKEDRVIRGLERWFRRNAPEYEVSDWPLERGPDFLVLGRGIMAAVDAVLRPKLEDVDQLVAGAGIVKLEEGRKPDLLVIYSYSGVVPEEVAEYAARRGVRIVKGPRELKALLDEEAERRTGTA